MANRLQEQIISQLFPAKEGDEDTLLFCSKVIDGGKETGTGLKALFQSNVQNDDEDEDDNKKGKMRIICITVRKSKARVLKLKQSGSSFTVAKQWHLDEIKSIESGVFTVN